MFHVVPLPGQSLPQSNGHQNHLGSCSKLRFPGLKSFRDSVLTVRPRKFQTLQAGSHSRGPWVVRGETRAYRPHVLTYTPVRRRLSASATDPKGDVQPHGSTWPPAPDDADATTRTLSRTGNSTKPVKTLGRSREGAVLTEGRRDRSRGRLGYSGM